MILAHRLCLCSLTMLFLPLAAQRSWAQAPIKPSMLIIFDTSGSMTWNISGTRTYGDGSVDYPGNDMNGNGLPDDSRMYILKEALANALWGTSEVQFGLMRYHQDEGVDIKYSTYYADRINYAGDDACEGGDVLVPIADDAVADILVWINQTEDFLHGDKELRGEGSTPIAASLTDARNYFRDQAIPNDPLNYCRSYFVLLLTDGEETCNGHPDNAASNLRAVRVGSTDYDVRTYVIGFGEGTDGSTTLNDVAVAGGTGAAYFAMDPTSLQVALNRIIQAAIPQEVCNGLDDDCNGLVDEGLIRPCDNACGSGSEACNNGNWGNCTAPPLISELCDGLDNDCDGQIDENLTQSCSTACGNGVETCANGIWLGCTAPQPQPEVCDGQDNDCDGTRDEDITQPCSTVCGAGVIPCNLGSWGECSAPQPRQEACDGIDNDCDGAIDEHLVRPCTNECGEGEETCVLGAWVNCTAPLGSPETCDARDNDCDGQVDEDLTRPCSNECGAGVERCVGGGWSACNAPTPQSEQCDGLDNDCDGQFDEALSRPCSTSCGVGQEICVNMQWVDCTAPQPQLESCDGLDNDCDGIIDNGLVRECQSGCGLGQEVCVAGAWINCTAPQPRNEVCDGVDNDCDGEIDEEVTRPCSTICGDGVIPCEEGAWQECTAPLPQAEVCDGLDNNCDGIIDNDLTRPCSTGCGSGIETCRMGAWVDCTAPASQPEVCDGRDNDCDGLVDEELTQTCSTACGEGTEVCVNGAWRNCNAPMPQVEVCDNVDNDCDGQVDETVARPCSSACGAGEEICIRGHWRPCNAPSPSAETCDGLDNDCDGLVDNGLTQECHTACGIGREVCVAGAWINCTAPQPRDEVCDGVDNDCDLLVDEDVTRPCESECGQGVVICTNGVWGDCSAPVPENERCDGEDNDCDGEIDEELTRPCANACGTGEETCSEGEWEGCTAPPGTTEICDGRDNDCDGVIDDNLRRSCTSICGLGLEMCMGGIWTGCTAPQPEPERCDGLDNDCDQMIDEDLTRACSSACGAGQEACLAGNWQGCTASQPQMEVCDGLDNDCDGLVDNGLTRDCQSVCGSGREVCVSGQWINCTAPEPIPEVCDGVDNDCDGTSDEDLVRPCESICGQGTATCQGGSWGECVAPPPSEEACDGQDNDCDGLIDENLSRECEAECGIGTQSCVSGEWGECVTLPPGPELCDGYDNDCDGQVDEDLMRPCSTVCGDGTQTCADARWTACSAPQPEAEICDNRDNDCDGQVDESVQRPCSSRCGSGVQICREGSWELCSAPDPVDEACDGLDNDCDGQVDEDLVEVCESACGDGVRICREGNWTECLAPAISDEVCDCIDNDCDGEIDEDAPCEVGTSCHSCECATPCAMGECPVGYGCINDFCITDPCYRMFCSEGRICIDGECVDLSCAAIECDEGLVCDKGVCVTADCYLLGCVAGTVCREGRCVFDACFDILCEEGFFCRWGDCVASCAGVECERGQRCVDGTCLADPCAAVSCDPGMVCEAGGCVEDPCGTVVCPQGRVCEGGLCMDDPCLAILCPAEEVCEGGQCVLPPVVSEDGGGPSDHDGGTLINDASLPPLGGDGGDGGVGGNGKSTTADCGCGLVSSRSGDGGGLAFLFALAALGLLLRGLRRGRMIDHGRRGWFAVLALTLLLGAGCGDDSVSHADVEAPPVVDPCLQGWVEPEICDGMDNDCDGEIDEGFELDTDPMNCGECGVVCELANAMSSCVRGKCAVDRCAEGWRDDNGDFVDGCEARCTPDGSGEVCDGVDNDCDGIVDNGIDTRIDVNNCGGCGRACSFPHGKALCVMSLCTLASCDEGFVDMDGDPSNGCEQRCQQSNNGIEICDDQDNDCNGRVDDGFNLSSDLANCGECNHMCALPNAVMTCIDGDCVMVACEPGFVNSDGVEANGCESACVNASAEVCDELDNDCDGTVDEDFDLATDGMNCGICGKVCAFANAVAGCENGLCIMISCESGFSDADGLLENGCEEICLETNGGVEACDGLDNDCDGRVDEEFDITTDPANCGICGRVCDLPDAMAGCFAGVCVVDHCEAGFIDADRLPGNGCEYPCAISNEGVEICDGLDNDCDGFEDEGYHLDRDTLNCGICGHRCDLPQATPACVDGDCLVLQCQEGYADANQDPDDGCEYSCTISNQGLEICDDLDNDCDGQVDEGFDFLRDHNNCGGCGRSCALANANVDCVGGDCVLIECSPGFLNLNGDIEDGCEYLCSITNGGEEICDYKDNDCNGIEDDGFDLESDVRNCAACGRICNLPHATPACSQGACVIDSCEPEWLDLDRDPLTGCETSCVATGEEVCDELDNDCNGLVDETFDLLGDPLNCGSCDHVCSLPRAVEGCRTGTCIVDHCFPGWVDADRVASNGCEYPCQVTNGGVEACDELDNDCDGYVDEDFQLEWDVQHCGGCGNACDLPQAVPFCMEGECLIMHCQEGFSDFNHDPLDGCEAICVITGGALEICDNVDNDCDGQVDEGFSLSVDINNCGECGHSCSLPNALVFCQDGQCGLEGCFEGFVDLNGDPSDGCEHLCTITNNGVEICDYLDNDCNGEVDEGFSLATDVENCGVCGWACDMANAVPICHEGSCEIQQCQPGWVDLDHNPVTGCELECTFTGAELCDFRDNDCDGLVDEDFDTTSDPQNCGICRRVCNLNHASSVCASGLCLVDQCVPGFVDADRIPTNGCEYPCVTSNGGVEACDNLDNDCDGFVDEGFQLDWDAQHCGGCGLACLLAHAVPMCVEGDCLVLDCVDGYHDANHDPSDGCEYPCHITNGGLEICDELDNDCDGLVDEGFNLMADINHCGECGHSCSIAASEVECHQGSCVLLGCAEGFWDLNGDPADGCEHVCTVTHNGVEFCDYMDNDCNGVVDDGYDLMNDTNNCGLCGRVCQLPRASESCGDGVCLILECEAGWVDMDRNPVNGCEQPCVPTGPEVCDGHDNDCDGMIDEDFDLLNDEGNCGVCGRQCTDQLNASTYCNSGECSVLSCLSGFRDANGDSADGCECAIQNGGIETCNMVDDDCSGVVDDNLGGPPLGFTCLILGVCQGVAPLCQDGAWVCPYPGSYEEDEVSCDGLDNDCDGHEDEPYPDRGGPCGVGEGVCRGEGEWICNDGRDGVVCTGVEQPDNEVHEVCDGLDNDCDGETDEDSDDMVQIAGPHGNFMIYRYEASRPDANSIDPGSSFDRACSKGDAMPWINVDHGTAEMACLDAGHRLCSEEEWVWACQGGTTRAYPYGANYNPTACNGWDLGLDGVIPTGDMDTCATVGAPIFDLSGNVWEWVVDEISPGVFAFHGGAFENLSGGLTCTYRNAADGTSYRHNIGFRCCDDL